MVQVLSKIFRQAAEVSVRIKLASDTNDYFAVASNHYRAYGTPHEFVWCETVVTQGTQTTIVPFE